MTVADRDGLVGDGVSVAVGVTVSAGVGDGGMDADADTDGDVVEPLELLELGPVEAGRPWP